MVPRVAVIGAGRYGEMHLRAFSQMQREGRAELVGVSDVDQALLSRQCDQRRHFHGLPEDELCSRSSGYSSDRHPDQSHEYLLEESS